MIKNSNRALIVKLNATNEKIDDWHSKMDYHKKKIKNNLKRLDAFALSI